MVVALITAGGVGKRFGSDVPKQFLCVDNKPILVYTLEKFQNNDNIDAIIVACLDGWQEYLIELKQKYSITKLRWSVVNGETQPMSISNCVDVLSEKIDDDDIVVIHAGNRPLVTDSIINNSIEICRKKGNAVAAIKCPEVIVDVVKNSIIERKNVLRLQTPQTFKFVDLKKFYRTIYEFDDVSTTCDLAIRLGEKINYIDGSSMNMKITYREDIQLFESLLDVNKK